MKQRHCIGDTAGFAEGGDAGGQAGGKARSTEAYRLHRGPFSKNHSTKGLSESNFRAAAFIRGKKTGSHAVRSHNFTFSLQGGLVPSKSSSN